MTQAANPEANRAALSVLFEKRKASLSALIPRHLSPGRVLQAAYLATMKDPKVAACDPMTVIGAVVEACKLGLEIGGWLGQCYVLPFAGKAQFVCGYKGFVALAWRSDKIAGVHGGVVRQGDDFEYQYGSGNLLRHVPAMVGGDVGSSMSAQPEPVVATWVGFKTTGGDFPFHVSDLAEILRSRNRSMAYKKDKSSPWHRHFEEMARVVPIRLMRSRLPMTPELSHALALTDAADAGRDQGLEEVAEQFKHVDSKEVPPPVDATREEEQRGKLMAGVLGCKSVDELIALEQEIKGAGFMDETFRAAIGKRETTLTA